MNHKNDFKAFSINNNANVVSQERYEESQSLKTGFPPDNITVHLLNKVLRQSSTIASVVSNFIATYSGNDVLDDGDIIKLAAQLNEALEQKIATKVPNASLTQKGVTQLTEVVGNSNTLAATQKLVSDVNNNANSKLAKSQNGADIPDKNEFVKNLGLVETVELAGNALDKRVGGDIYGKISLRGDKRLGYYITDDDGRIRAEIYKDKGGNLILTNGYDGGGLFIIRQDGAVSFGNASSAITGDGNIYGKVWSISSDPGYLYDYLDHLCPVGVPLPYPHRYTPVGYLTCNGQAFDKSLYPKLAKVYPSGKVPDLRGEFIRGWDDGRGVDSGRGVLSWQADEFKSHKHILPTGRMAVGVDGLASTWVVVENDVSPTKVSTHEAGSAKETRPRNVAFNYIVRAI